MLNIVVGVLIALKLANVGDVEISTIVFLIIANYGNQFINYILNRNKQEV